MTKTRGIGVVLFAVLLTGAACKTTEDQQAAVNECKKFGNASKQCEYANLMLASGSTGIAKSLKQAEEARAAEEARTAEAQAQAAALAAKGVDPCDELKQKLTEKFPGPECEKMMGDVMDYLQQDPGCPGWLNDLQGAEDEAYNFLGDCAAGAP